MKGEDLRMRIIGKSAKFESNFVSQSLLYFSCAKRNFGENA